MLDEPARPHLRVVDTYTGELVEGVCPSCGELQEQVKSLNKVITARDRRITEVSNKLAEAMGVEPEAEQIVEVLVFWRTVLDSNASIVAGSDNWTAVRSRLRDTDVVTKEKRFNVLKLKAAVIGITLDDWHMAKGQSHRRHPKNAFRDADRVDLLIGKAVGFKRTTGVSALGVVDELAGEGLRWLAERCGCGHTWLSHLRGGEAAQGGAQACSHEDCPCGMFDSFHAKVERFMREQE